MAAPTTPAGAPAEPAGRHRVRRAEPRDVAALDAMVRELAAYEREPDAVRATPEDLRAALFGPGATVGAHVAEVADAEGPPEELDGAHGGWRVVGMAVWFTTYSTWTGRGGTWLEDLYVQPAARGRGLGRSLLAALAATAVAAGHPRLEWTVLDWNTPAQAVYRAVGAAPQDGWTTWRLAGEPLAALADRAGPSGRPTDDRAADRPASRPPGARGAGGSTGGAARETMAP